MACFNSWDIGACGCAAPLNCGTCCNSCSPYPIPNANLSCTWSGGSGGTCTPCSGSGTAPPYAGGGGTMTYYPGGYGASAYLGGVFFSGPTWVYQVWQPTAISTQVLLSCSGGTYKVAIVALNSSGAGNNCCSYVSNYTFNDVTHCPSGSIGGGLTITSTTQNPFAISCSIAGSGAYNCQNKYYGSLAITGPAYGSTTCCQTFNVTGCFSQDLMGIAVGVYDYAGGTLLAGGYTYGNGSCTLAWSGPCSVYYLVTDPLGRFTAYGASATLTAGGTKNITVTQFPVASGYTCFAKAGTTTCAYPLPNTLHCTFTGAGVVDFTWNSGTSKWETANTFSYLGVNYFLTLNASGTMTGTGNGTGFSVTFAFVQVGSNYDCPVTGPFQGKVFVPISGLGSALGAGPNYITEGP